MVRVVHRLLKDSVLCESQRDGLLVLRALQNLWDEPGFVETISDLCPVPDNPAPTAKIDEHPLKGFCDALTGRTTPPAPASTAKEE